MLPKAKRRTNDEVFVPLNGSGFSVQALLLKISLECWENTLIGPPQQCVSNTFSYDIFGDHLQTCQPKSADSQVHDSVVYKMGTLLGSVGHRVKIHKITPETDKERGDLEIKD